MLKKFIPAKPKRGQEEYSDALQSKQIVFVSGHAGSGKSILALNEAVKCIHDDKNPIKKICIIRPYIFTRSENIGALPGTLDEKILPFVEAIKDNLECLLPMKQDIEAVLRSLEFLTLSTLRGRSLHNRFILVEEAQNVPVEGDGMLTILTRLGQNSRIVIAGDLSQCDLDPRDSSFLEAVNALSSLEEVSYVEMNNTECIYRNPVIGRILQAFTTFREQHG